MDRRSQTEGGRTIEAAGLKYGYGDAAERTALSSTASSAASVFKPGIAAGVSMCALAGMSLGARGVPSLTAAALCLSCIMAAAMGSGAINSVLDRRMDAVMPRVGGRAAALARLGGVPVLSASVLLVALPLAVSYINFGPLTAALILCAVLSYTVLYTLWLKRRSPFGTVPGGLPGALPALIGYSAVSPSIGPDGFLLFAVMMLWQPPHFLALALKFRSEYSRAGVPVMPVVLGERFTVAFMFIYMSALIPAGTALWLFGPASAYFGLLAFAAGLLYLYVSYVEVVRRKRYGRAFAASIAYIMVILTGLLVDSAAF